VRKPKIESLIPLVLRRSQILQLPRLRQCIPLPFTLLVAEDVVDLREQVQHNIGNGQGQQHPIALLALWCVIC